MTKDTDPQEMDTSKMSLGTAPGCCPQRGVVGENSVAREPVAMGQAANVKAQGHWLVHLDGAASAGRILSLRVAAALVLPNKS